MILEQVAYDDPDVQHLAAQAQEYYRSLYGTPDESPIAATEFAAPLGEFWLGRIDGEPVTMGGWRRTPVPPAECGGEPAAELKRMFSVPTLRRRGLARTMLMHLEARALAAGIRWLVLETGRPQVEAIALYTSCGYAQIAGFAHYACAPESYSMGKRIAPAPTR